MSDCQLVMCVFGFIIVALVGTLYHTQVMLWESRKREEEYHDLVRQR